MPPRHPRPISAAPSVQAPKPPEVPVAERRRPTDLQLALMQRSYAAAVAAAEALEQAGRTLERARGAHAFVLGEVAASFDIPVQAFRLDNDGYVVEPREGAL